MSIGWDLGQEMTRKKIINMENKCHTTMKNWSRLLRHSLSKSDELCDLSLESSHKDSSSSSQTSPSSEAEIVHVNACHASESTEFSGGDPTASKEVSLTIQTTTQLKIQCNSMLR